MNKEINEKVDIIQNRLIDLNMRISQLQYEYDQKSKNYAHSFWITLISQIILLVAIVVLLY